ncbi:MFS family permease [Erwinia toletana]|uniref:MFS family permease n=1 Tax=Winslowiella toletana TaxID=92490 RepID=A0ABS4PFR4_9GAMM|nr:MFS transporter [Winslowiella toletana]MBP2171489.1 MFS family permease [Winslowiella toletana]
MNSTTLQRSGLLVLLAGQLLPMIDFSIVNVALESMAASLHASPLQLELIVAVYGIAFAVCLAMGGRFGDNLGRRRIFTLGVLLFALASLLCGVASNVGTMLAARALQGIGAALIVPQILATLHVCLHGREHARAIGLYGGIGGLAFIIGQVLGGFLVGADIGGYGWRSVFLINIPICLMILVLVRRVVPETRNAERVGIDLAGTSLLGAAIASLMIALSLGPLLHWSWPCLLLLALFPLLLKRLWQAELRLEARQGVPLLPPSLLRLSAVKFAIGMAVLFFSSWSGFMFAVALTLQTGIGLSAFQSGNAFIALGVAYFLASLLTSGMIERRGRLTTLLTGCAIQMCGLVLLILTFRFAWGHIGIVQLIPATALIGFGQAFIVGCFYRIGLAEVPKNQAGAGSAMLSTVQQAAFGLGPMLLGSIFSQVLQHQASYQHAVIAALTAEWLIMLVLVAYAVLTRRQLLPQPDC